MILEERDTQRQPGSGASGPEAMAPPAPSARPLSAPARMPVQFTRFFGREEEIAWLTAALRVPETRLVTLTGPGGSGKTRLAIAVAGRLQEEFSEAVWFVPLAEVAEARRIGDAIRDAMRLPPSPDGEPFEQVVAALSSQPSLLLLDNFEHLLGNANPGVGGDASASAGGGPALVRRLLERVPQLTCLVTSRQALHLSGEQEFPVPPLGMPLGTDTPERLLEYGSVALYVDRAQLEKPGFALTAHNAEAISALCRRMEGMPLAIEMAAAWAKTLPPTRMLERLERQLDLLVSRQRDLPPRHQSLRATIEWSYDLLPPVLRQFFARLSVFRGGWTLEAAEAVCGADALTLLAQLQDRSLIVLEEPDGPRYRILEPLREYAVEKLEAHGETGLARARHAACFLALAEQAEPELSERNKKQWLDRLEVEFDNLRAALAWYDAEEGGAVMGLRLAGALRLFWALRGRQAEGREWLERALSRAAARTEARAKALDAAGNIARELGELAAAEARFAESLAIMQELGDRQGIANGLNNLGLVAIDRKEHEAARSLHEQSMAIMREIGDPRGIAHSLFNLGALARQQGDPHAARAYWAECRAVDEALGVKGGMLNWVLGELAQEQGNYAEAGRHWRTGLIEWQEIGLKVGVGRAIEYLASLALLEGQPRRSARLWGAATAIHEASGTSFQPDVQTAFEKDAGQIRAAMGEEAFRTSFAEGRALTFQQAVEYALGSAE